MAPTQPTVSLDDMLKAERQKKKHEKVFQNLLAKSRRSTGTPTGGSLASRVSNGVNKRSASITPIVRAQRGGRGGRGGLLENRANSSSRIERGNRMLNQIQTATVNNSLSNVANIRSHANSELSIRGRAVPTTYTVMASNFAPGTTAADIQSTFATYGDVISCKMVAANPTPIAEVVFRELSEAQTVISMFNNKKADGRVLHVYLREPVETSFNNAHTRPAVRARVQRDAMEVDEEPPPPRRAEPQLQDGRYGFNEGTYTANTGGRRQDRGSRPDGQGFRSDEMIGRGRERGRRR